MKTLSFITILLLASFASKSQVKCEVNPQQENVARELKTETTHDPLGTKPTKVYMVQYGVFLNEPENLPMFVIAYPFQVIHEGISKTMWIAFWGRHFYLRADAEFVVEDLKRRGVCQPFIKEVILGE